MGELKEKGRHYLRKSCPVCGGQAEYLYRPYCSFSCQFLDPSQPSPSNGAFRGNKERGMKKRQMEEKK